MQKAGGGEGTFSEDSILFLLQVRKIMEIAGLSGKRKI